MKFGIYSLTVSALLGFSVTAHAATLIPEQGVSLLYINGQETTGRTDKVQLADGQTQVVLKMDKTVGKGNSKEVFTSDPYVVTFEASGESIKIKHPKARSIQEVERAFKGHNPEWAITIDGRAVSYQQEHLQGKSGLFPYGDLDELVKNHNQKRGIFFKGDELQKIEVAAPVVAATTVTAVSQVANDTTPKPAMPSDNLEQLKAWYMKASKEERKAFRRWMIDAE